jgi:phosphatidylserine/phosphatidylglycerophosphate/cardiolipin synthase-like enzyme
MKKALQWLLLGVAAFFLFATVSGSRTSSARAAEGITLCFTPEYQGGPRCTDLVLGAINSARTTILVQAYFLTSRSITQALVRAYQRGVRVQVILDRRNALHFGYPEAMFLARFGIIPLLDGAHKNAHNKIMIIDNQTVITGSFNFTYSAEHYDAENLLLINDSALARAYTENFALHAKHSVPYM